MTKRIRAGTKKESSPGPRDKVARAKLFELIEEATIDCHDESEQRLGLYTMLEDNLELPFQTDVLGVRVTVERIDMTDEEEIVAICTRGRARQAICLLELPLPVPRPQGAEWIDAYGYWARGGRMK
ncbi:MAG TPA: calcium-binding protein [Thermoanaerobaculia bacterium]|nr:calcium-binding protein [Thermoanaerobaculia bacterium]